MYYYIPRLFLIKPIGFFFCCENMANNQRASQKRFDRAAAELAGACPVEPPAKRVRGKSSEPEVEIPRTSVAKEVKDHGGDAKKPASRFPARHTPVKTTGPPLASWDNFKLIQDHYRLSDEETTAVLLDVLGPDHRGSGFWKHYQERVKKELPQVKSEVKSEVPGTEALSEVTTATPNRMLHDNQLGDPDLCPEYENGKTDDDFDGEEAEEEPFGDDDDVVVEVSKGGGGDDADSPSGAASVSPEQPEMMVSAQPTCPTEPVKGGGVVKDAAAKDASDDFKFFAG